MSRDDTTEAGRAFGPLSGTEGKAAAEAPNRSAADPNLGRRIGPYRVGRRLARGGMGVVYLGLSEDDYEQKVALKRIDPERLSVHGLDRFYRDDTRSAVAESVWGRYLAAMGRYSEAEQSLLASYRRLQRLEGGEDEATRAAARRTAAFYEAWGRNEEAAAWWAAAEGMEGRPGVTRDAPSP